MFMKEEEIIEELKKLEEKVGINIRINQEIRTILMVIMVSFVLFTVLLLTSFPDPFIASFILIVPFLVGMFKILRRRGWI